MHIDLNCDLGEGAAHDAELMPLITSANIACGAHAGDAATMRRSVELALAHGVAIGAHPGFLDRENFGRRELSLPANEVFDLVFEQIEALQRIAAQFGARLSHVKPHGGLYNLAARDRAVADAIARAVCQTNASLALFGLAGSALIAAAEARGLTAAQEVFADRSYQCNGSLTPRSQPDALLTSADASRAQVLRFIREGKVRAVDGTDVAVRADTVCLHGDGPLAVEFARELRRSLEAARIEVRAFHASGKAKAP